MSLQIFGASFTDLTKC